MSERQTYLLVDGENIDCLLYDIISRKLTAEDRPIWSNVRRFIHEVWQAESSRALFFRNDTSGNPPLAFIAALVSMDFQPVMLSGPSGRKVVDEGIKKVLGHILEHGGNVILMSHDADFAPEIEALVKARRRTAVLCFPEMLADGLRKLADDGMEIFDLEFHANAFRHRLPRRRIIDVDAFDPKEFM